MKPVLSRFWRRAVRAIGYSGPAALLLFVVTVAIALWLARLDRDLKRTQAEVTDRTARLRAHGPVSLRAPSGDERLAQYIEAFPMPTQMAADLGAIYASAGRHELDLLKGEYQLKAEPGAPFVTYVVTLPVHGQYRLVKAFAANVLQDLPHAALDEFRLGRENTEAEVLDGVVRFTLVYRSR